jgi:hypothetical protein
MVGNTSRQESSTEEKKTMEKKTARRLKVVMARGEVARWLDGNLNPVGKPIEDPSTIRALYMAGEAKCIAIPTPTTTVGDLLRETFKGKEYLEASEEDTLFAVFIAPSPEWDPPNVRTGHSDSWDSAPEQAIYVLSGSGYRDHEEE